ncbi:peroxidase 72-like [Dendrobium catenatum]|uniref:Peroxidase n=1 Tax=Dendrobium catenatum TaxID=906689 RepID=A0A2I0X575_9ASPA|nr:peroxidase 72-like [Dendrobium catenatum]PKU83052.1 Peroxidase 72 [Dendrobium catenatum]
MSFSLSSPLLLLLLSLLVFSYPLCFGQVGNGGAKLHPKFYEHSCPRVEDIVKKGMAEAVSENPRWAASILRLHFHDCFVKGCDGSILLDSSGAFLSEKRSVPNRDSARGFEIIDKIKATVEKTCPETVSCADILTLAARDGTVLTGGPNWVVPLGRRDSRSASLSGSNNDIPAPNNTLNTIITKFKRQGLNVVDVVALSGSHTIGKSRCTSFRQRLYNQTGNGLPDNTLDQTYAAKLRTRCPISGGDQTIFSLDFISPTKFDNQYYKNIIAKKGLLSSDEVLFTKSEETKKLVTKFAESNEHFFKQFAKSIVKMGNISPLTGSHGEIRKICRRVNH